MRLNTELLFDYLSDIYRIEKCGVDVRTLSLNPPVFYDEKLGWIRHAIYICQDTDVTVPAEAEDCLFIICGTAAAYAKERKCSILVLEDNPSIWEVFNHVQKLFLKYRNWIRDLQTVLDDSADIGKMTEITSILLDECITLCNKDLEISLFHNPHPEKKVEFVHLTTEGMKMFLASHATNTSHRAPFIFQGDANTYCLNVYKNEEYLGVLALPEVYHKLTEGRTQLFNIFYSYLYKAIDKLNLDSHGGLINLKMIFRGILRGETLDEYALNKALYTYNYNPVKWLCLASRLTESMRNLPAEFLCKKIEESDANIIAVEHDGYIIMLIPVQDEQTAHNLPEKFLAVVKTLLGNAGASIVFNNITNAQVYYRQAVAAQKTGLSRKKADAILYFGDQAFDYIMDNSIGDFTPKYLLPKELLALRKKDKAIGELDNWDILKCFLDNEMSTSITARELYIHRTTLQHKIDKIREMLDLSDPRNRLYIHYCMYLYDSYEALLTSTP